MLLYGLVCVPFGVFVAVGPRILGNRNFAYLVWLAIGVFWLLLLIVGQWEVRMKRALKKRVTEHNNLLCFTCGYCLIGASDKCPECGTPFDREEVVKFWQEWQPTSGLFRNRKKDALLSNRP